MNTSLYEDGYNEGVRITMKNMKKNIVNNLRSKGFSDEEINNLTEFSLDYIKSI